MIPILTSPESSNDTFLNNDTEPNAAFTGTSGWSAYTSDPATIFGSFSSIGSFSNIGLLNQASDLINNGIVNGIVPPQLVVEEEPLEEIVDRQLIDLQSSKNRWVFI